jgi:hypothetical protein
MQSTDGKCTVCRRRPPVTGRICTPDLDTLNDLLADLPRKMRLLPMMLMPGQSPGGEKVATTRVGSPTSARLDALSLVGPGSVPVPGALHPMIRKWATTREVEVEVRVAVGVTEVHVTTLTDWHQEIVVDSLTGEPVMVSHDDQAGVLPPSEWLAKQSRAWRAAFGHTRNSLVVAAKLLGPVQAFPPRDPVQWVLTRGTAEQVKALYAVDELRKQFRQGVTDLVVGYEPGYGGRRPTGLREDDPVADLWQLRFGEPGLTRDDSVHINYLRTWLEQAAGRDDVDIAGFAAELRSLSAELTRVLGEKPDNQWLGKCPAVIADPETGWKDPCGAGLWQDPHASVVECPRCHSTWGPYVVHLFHLAAEIRRVWPLDRRRRYTADEIDALKPIRCPGCGEPDIEIGWQEVTALGDRRRWWRPQRTRCPAGCAKAGEIL